MVFGNVRQRMKNNNFYIELRPDLKLRFDNHC